MAPTSVLWRSLIAAGMYATAGTMMTITNKWVVSTWEFSMFNTLLLGQMVLSVGSLSWLRSRKYVEFPRIDLRSSSTPLRLLIGLSFVYIANVGCALTALRLTSVPVYNVLKRMTPFPVMITDFLLRGERFPPIIVVSVLMIVLGAVITGNGDMDFDPLGYSLAIASCGLQALYLVLTSKAHDVGYSSQTILYYNSLWAMPFLAILVLLFEVERLHKYAYYGSVWFEVCLLGCLSMGSVLNFCLVYCTTSNSALTTVVVGQLKGLLSTLLGFVLFGQVRLTPAGILGLVLNSCGGGVYAIAKYRAYTSAVSVTTTAVVAASVSAASISAAASAVGGSEANGGQVLMKHGHYSAHRGGVVVAAVSPV